MGGNLSRAESEPTATEVLKLIKKEVTLWNDTVKNIEKDSTFRQHGWVEDYLRGRIEETEQKLLQLKSRYEKTPEKSKDERIRQMDANIQRLLENKKKTEMECMKLKEKVENYERKLQELQRGRKDEKEESSQPKAETRSNTPLDEKDNVKTEKGKEMDGTKTDQAMVDVNSVRNDLLEKEKSVSRLTEERKDLLKELSLVKEDNSRLEKHNKDLDRKLKEAQETNKTPEKSKDERIRQMDANIQRLLENKNKAETECMDLRRKAEYYEKKIQDLQRDRKDEKEESSKPKAETRSNTPPDEKDIVKSEKGKELDGTKTEQAMVDDNIVRNDLLEKEKTVSRLTEERKDLLEELSSIKKNNSRLEKHNEDLGRKLKEAQETNKRNNENLISLQESRNTGSGNCNVDQALHKQRKELEEKYKIEKLKMLEDHQIMLAQTESSWEIQVKQLEKEKNVLLLRLSKIAGERLVENNPAVTDLSDPNRPTKLGEAYSELYDNEWTDAFEAMKKAGHDERRAIETLRLTLEHVVRFCESKAELVIKKSTDAVNLLFGDKQTHVKVSDHATVPRKQALELRQQISREQSSMDDLRLQHRWKPCRPQDMARHVKDKISENQEKAESPKVNAESKFKQLRREMALPMVQLVQKAYMEMNWSDECIMGLKPYILKCIYIGWMMAVQDVPMALHSQPTGQDVRFEKAIYKEYTASGQFVSYIVWPALLLHKDGPIVCKGVAEGRKVS